MPLTYQVLRNNQQTGPYTLEELRSLGLKDTDLIWMEGQAGGWRYPADVAELRPEPAVGSQQSAVRSQEPGVGSNDPIEEKAARLHARMQAYLQEQGQKEVSGEEGEPHTRYVRSLDQLRQDYADWLHQKHRKKVSGRLPAAMLIAIILFCSGFLASRWYYGNESGHPDIRLTAEERERLKPQPAILTEIVPVPRAAYGDSAVRSRQPEVRIKQSAEPWRSIKLKAKTVSVGNPAPAPPRAKKQKAQPLDTVKPTVADLVNKYTGYKVMQK